jgi:hypothetical protein
MGVKTQPVAQIFIAIISDIYQEQFIGDLTVKARMYQVGNS